MGYDLPADLNLAAELDAVLADFKEIVDISLSNTMLLDRLEGTGRLTTRPPSITACWATWRAPRASTSTRAATIPLPPISA